MGLSRSWNASPSMLGVLPPFTCRYATLIRLITENLVDPEPSGLRVRCRTSNRTSPCWKYWRTARLFYTIFQTFIVYRQTPNIKAKQKHAVVFLLEHFTCRRSMKASWSVSPWKPGTGSELANTWQTHTPAQQDHIRPVRQNSRCVKECEEFAALTFTLNHVQVELLDGSHADLLQLRVQQHLHQRRGQMFAGWHAGCLGHLTLERRRRREGGKGESMCKKKKWKWGMMYRNDYNMKGKKIKAEGTKELTTSTGETRRWIIQQESGNRMRVLLKKIGGKKPGCINR